MWRARSSAGVEETRKEDDDEAIADTSGSARYGWGEKGWGAQVVYGGEEEGVRRGGIGEGHVGILRCQSEGRGWGSVVGHFEYGSLCYVTLDRGICVIGVPRFVTWSHKPIALSPSSGQPTRRSTRPTNRSLGPSASRSSIPHHNIRFRKKGRYIVMKMVVTKLLMSEFEGKPDSGASPSRQRTR